MTAFGGGGWGSLAAAVSTDGRRIAAVREQEIRMTESATNRICWQIELPLSEQDMVPQDLAFVATNRWLVVQSLTVNFHAYEGPCVYDTRSWKPA